MITLQMIPAAALWMVVIVRLAGLGFGWRYGFLPGLFVVALGTTLNIDQIYLFVDGLLGGQNHLNLIVHLLMGAGMTELARLLLKATGRAGKNDLHIKVLLAGAGVMAVLQTVLLLASDTPGSATNFTDKFAGLPLIAPYQASFFAWIGLILAITGVECLRRNNDNETRSFRIGFNIVAGACLAGVVGILIKMVLIGMEIFETDGPFWLYILYRVFIALTMSGFAVGFTVTSFSRIRSSFAARKQRRRDLNALRPIVKRLLETCEGSRAQNAAKISLDATTSKVQLYRWFILIGDIKVLESELLTAEEAAIYDEIGKRIERNGIPAQHTAVAVG